VKGLEGTDRAASGVRVTACGITKRYGVRLEDLCVYAGPDAMLSLTFLCSAREDLRPRIARGLSAVLATCVDRGFRFKKAPPLPPSCTRMRRILRGEEKC
jgi:hypothetical protein